MILQYTIIVLLFCAIFSIKRHITHYVFVCFVILVGTIESVVGVFQTMGLVRPWYKINHIICGTFYNSGPYGAMIAIGMAVALASAWRQHNRQESASKPIYYLSLTSLIMGFVVLPASRSRAAWVGLAVAVVALLFREADLASWIRKHRLIATGVVVFILLAGIGIFQMKKDSAIGRFHIWNIECRAIAAHPWTGVGFDKIFKAYGDTQSAFFKESKRPAAIVRVAGSPTYAYNEYLKFGMAWGIGGVLLAVSVGLFVIWCLFRKNSPLSYGAIVYAVFAFASFPLSVVQLKMLGTLLLAAALAPEKGDHAWIFWLVGLLCCACVVASIEAYPHEKARRRAERVWKSSPYLKQELYDLSVFRLKPLYLRLNDNYKYLYDYGYSLHKTGEYEESNRILQQGADISCDPIFHTIMAKNYIALGQYGKAETELMNAHWLIPCRIYPLLLLMRQYVDSERVMDAIEVGRTIKNMPVNGRNPNMVALYSEAMTLLNELEMRR